MQIAKERSCGTSSRVRPVSFRTSDVGTQPAFPLCKLQNLCTNGRVLELVLRGSLQYHCHSDVCECVTSMSLWCSLQYHGHCHSHGRRRCHRRLSLSSWRSLSTSADSYLKAHRNAGVLNKRPLSVLSSLACLLAYSREPAHA